MPRKLHMKPEAEAPMERPGAGSPDDSGVRKKPNAPIAAEAEPSVLIDPSFLTDIEKKATSRYEQREKLMEEAADIKKRQEEMGGVWGGEAYFLEEDRLKEIEKALGIKPKAPKAPKTETAMEPVMPSEVDLEKAKLKDLEKQRKRIEAGQKRVREELKEYGINSVEHIEDQLEKIEEELRAESEGKKPGFGYQLRKFVRRLSGQEVPVKAKDALKEYLELEQRMNANTRDMKEINDERMARTGRSGASIELSRSGRVFHPAMAAEPEPMTGKGSNKDVAEQIAALKEAEPSTIGEKRARYEELEKEMAELSAEAVRSGTIPEEFDRLVAKLDKTKDKELAMLVQGYQRKMKEAEVLRHELESDASPEGSMRVEAAKARAHAATREEREAKFAEKPVAEQQAESREKLLVQEVRELGGFIEDAIKNLEGVKDEMDVWAYEELFENKLQDFSTLIRKYETEGQGSVFDEALQNAEDALARYAVALNRRLTRIKKQAAEAGKGTPRPESVIMARAGRSGSYGTDTAPRREVRLTNLETPETQERNKRELVNREIEVYRTAEWRKNLIDRINADESWRGFMHGVYEDVTSRLKQLHESGHATEAGTPDVALDYALALFRGHARRGADDSYIYTESDRKMAQEEVRRLDEMFGWGERYKVKEAPEVTVSEATPEEREEIEAAVAEEAIEKRKRMPKPKEVTLSVAEAQANFDKINTELEEAGVTSLADKMNDPMFLKADSDLRHAKRANRSTRVKEAVRAYKGKKKAAEIAKFDEAANASFEQSFKNLEGENEKFDQAAEDLEKSMEAEREAEEGIPSLQELVALAKSGDNDQQISALEKVSEPLPSEDAPVMIEEAPKKPSKRPSKKPKPEASPLSAPINLAEERKKRRKSA